MQEDPKSLSQARYSRFAEGYVRSETHAKGHDLDRLIAIAKPQNDWIALDVATGGGHTALAFAPYVARAVATDLTEAMLAAAEAHLSERGVINVEFQRADAEALPFEDERFELVTCRIAAHHFPSPQRFVDEAARVLKPGGLLLIQDHVLPEDEAAARAVDDFERLRDPSHVRACSEPEWREMIASAGLEVEHAERVVKRHEFAAWAERQGNDPATVQALVTMMDAMPPAARAWLDPQDWGSDGATFVNRHLIVAGRKPA